jgi:hypothetical protein
VSGEAAVLEAKLPNVGDSIRQRSRSVGPLLITPPRKAGKPLFAQELLDSGDTEPVFASALELVANVVDGQVLLSQCDDQLTHGVLAGLALWPMWDVAKEVAVHLVAKSPTQDTKGSGLIAEAACRLRRRQPVDEVGTKGFVLTVPCIRGLEEEPRLTC